VRKWRRKISSRQAHHSRIDLQGLHSACRRPESDNGHYASKDAKKIYDDNAKHRELTIAGDVGDAQAVIRLLKAETKLYELQE